VEPAKEEEGEAEPEGGNNNDFCEACGYGGSLLCCDGCPKAFHLECLDPPLTEGDLDDKDWFCKECNVAKVGSFKIFDLRSKGLEQIVNVESRSEHLSEVFKVLVSQNPESFHLPKSLKQKMVNAGMESLTSVIAHISLDAKIEERQMYGMTIPKNNEDIALRYTPQQGPVKQKKPKTEVNVRFNLNFN
jgi:hypothetical protein